MQIVCYIKNALSARTNIRTSPPVALETTQVVPSKHAAGGVSQLVTYKVLVPKEHHPRLDDLSVSARVILDRMLSNRDLTSTSLYKEVPSVVAKGLSAKYQRNPKCKRVTRLCLPVCGDKGRQVKVVAGGMRVPALFKKAVIACQFPLPVAGFIRQIECFKRGGIGLCPIVIRRYVRRSSSQLGVLGWTETRLGISL